MRYFINLSYLGSPFHGWQCQPNAISVQEVLEDALTTVLRAPIKVTGASCHPKSGFYLDNLEELKTVIEALEASHLTKK